MTTNVLKEVLCTFQSLSRGSSICFTMISMVVRSVVFTRYWFNPELLKAVDMSSRTIGIGDFVLVIDSHEEVKALQDEEHGGWVEKMRKVYTLFNCFNEIPLLVVALLSIHVTIVMWLHSYPMYEKGKPTRSTYILINFSIYVCLEF